MSNIATYIFLDIETTGLPHQQKNQTQVTELSLVAVKGQQILHAANIMRSSGEAVIPRILNKLSLCFQPDLTIPEIVYEISGLSNDNLRNEAKFNRESFDAIARFIGCQMRPICFVAHNGNRFDYPILRSEIDRIGTRLGDDLLCVDSLPMFRQIPETRIFKHSSDDEFPDDISSEDLMIIADIEASFADELSQTFENVINIQTPNKIKPERKSMKLSEIYFRTFGKPFDNSHRAEADCLALMQICIAKCEDFFIWSHNNYKKFNDIPKLGSKSSDSANSSKSPSVNKNLNDLFS